MKLSDIQHAANTKYASTPIELSDGSTVELVNALQLSEKDRATLVAIQKELSAEDASQVEVLEKALLAASNDKAKGKQLIKEIGGNLAVLVETFHVYNEDTQAGEA